MMNIQELNRITLFAEYYNSNDLIPCTAGQQFDMVKTDGPYEPEFHVFHYVLKGKGTLEIGGKKHNIQAGDLFFLPENVTCTYYSDPIEPYSYYWISFRGKQANYLLRKCNLSADNPILHLSNRRIENLFIRMFRDIHKHNLSSSLNVLSHLYELFSILIDKTNETPLPTLHYQIERALEYFQQHFQEDISISDVAKHIGFNRPYFASLFKKQVGLSPKEYLLQIRLSYSKDLLKNTNKPIETIAEECGMERMHFTRAFKSAFHCPPTEYRKQKRKETSQKEEITKK